MVRELGRELMYVDSNMGLSRCLTSASPPFPPPALNLLKVVLAIKSYLQEIILDVVNDDIFFNF
jgi:hypothetical protein